MCQPDCVGYYAYVHSLITDGDLSVGNQFAEWKLARAFTNVTAYGHANDVFAFGSAVLWLPFVGVTHGVLQLVRVFDASVEANGLSAPYLQAVSFGTSWYGYLAIVLCYRLAARVTTRGIALWATVAVSGLTSTWQYLFFDGILSHTLSAFADALFALLALTMLGGADKANPVRRARSSWVALGLVGGLVALVRWQEAVLPALVGALLMVESVRFTHARFSRRVAAGPRWECAPLSAAVCYLAGCVLGFLPQLCIWHLQHGSWLALPQGASFFHPWNPALSYVLLSSHHGLFVWTPLVFLSLIGLALLLKRQPFIATAAILVFLAQAYINSIVLDPAAGISFGSRRFTSLLVFNVLGLAAFLSHVPRPIGVVVSTLAACWTFPLWLAFHFQFLDPARFTSFNDLYDAVTHAIRLAPHLLPHMQLRFSTRLEGPQAWIPLAYPLWAIGVSGAVLIAARILRSQTRHHIPSALLFSVAALVNVVTFAATSRSQPLPIRIVPSGQAAQIDFGEYANSRFDGNPFDTRTYGLTAYNLPAKAHWGDVPFYFLPPPADHQPAPSVLSTCGLPLTRFRLPLDAMPTRALHFAIGAGGAMESGLPVLRFVVETESGATHSRTLRADFDIWDIFKTPPRQALVYNELSSVTGFTVSYDPPIQPSSLTIESPVSPRAIWPCAAVFAITQELMPPDGSDRRAYRSVSLAPVANADHGRDAFRPATVHNFFPKLDPGTMHLGGVPFLLLDRRNTPSGQSALTNVGPPGFRIRLPLARAASLRLSLLLTASVPLNANEQLAELEVQYHRGPSTKATVLAGQVVGHDPARVSEPPSLHTFTIRLDPKRTPHYVWLKRPQTPQLADAGIAILAVTQQLQDTSGSPGQSLVARPER